MDETDPKKQHRGRMYKVTPDAALRDWLGLGPGKRSIRNLYCFYQSQPSYAPISEERLSRWKREGDWARFTKEWDLTEKRRAAQREFGILMQDTSADEVEGDSAGLRSLSGWCLRRAMGILCASLKPKNDIERVAAVEKLAKIAQDLQKTASQLDGTTAPAESPKKKAGDPDLVSTGKGERATGAAGKLTLIEGKLDQADGNPA